MQVNGIEAARKFWDLHPYKNIFFPSVEDYFEKMIDFYINLGLAPKTRYDAVMKEHEKLQYENTFLRETINQLGAIILAADGEEKVQLVWNSVVYKWIGVNTEIANNFFELSGQRSTDSSGKEEPFNDIERRLQTRHTFLCPVEFMLNETSDKPVNGVILNFSESGLCIYSLIPLNKGQKIIIRSPLPIRHATFTVQWSNASRTGLSAHHEQSNQRAVGDSRR
jgi:hypothetical protein